MKHPFEQMIEDHLLDNSTMRGMTYEWSRAGRGNYMWLAATCGMNLYDSYEALGETWIAYLKERWGE